MGGFNVEVVVEGSASKATLVSPNTHFFGCENLDVREELQNMFSLAALSLGHVQFQWSVFCISSLQRGQWICRETEEIAVRFRERCATSSKFCEEQRANTIADCFIIF